MSALFLWFPEVLAVRAAPKRSDDCKRLSQRQFHLLIESLCQTQPPIGVSMLQSLLCGKICEACQTLQIKRPTSPTMGLSLLPRHWRCRLRPTRICRRGQFSTEPVFSREDDVSRKHCSSLCWLPSSTQAKAHRRVLPPGCRFPHSVRELFIRRDDERVLLPPCPPDWFGFFASGLKTSADFMSGNACRFRSAWFDLRPVKRGLG